MADEKKTPQNAEETPEKKESGSAKAEGGDMQALLQKLDSMEKLLEQQVQSGKKLKRSRNLMALLMAALVAVFAFGLYSLNQTVSHATKELPALIATTTRSVEQLEVTLKDVSSVDFEELNTAIQELGDGLGAMDFEALNQSIVDLGEVVEGLGNVMSVFR